MYTPAARQWVPQSIPVTPEAWNPRATTCVLSCENPLVVMVRQVGSAPQLRPCLYSLPPICQHYRIPQESTVGGTVRECALLRAARDAPRVAPCVTGIRFGGRLAADGLPPPSRNGLAYSLKARFRQATGWQQCQSTLTSHSWKCQINMAARQQTCQSDLKAHSFTHCHIDMAAHQQTCQSDLTVRSSG